MSEQNNDPKSTEVKKVSLAELMKRKLESQKQDQNKGQSFSSSNNSNNKLKSQHKQSTIKRSRSGE